MPALESLHLSFGNQTLFENLTLEIPKGQTTCFIGPSGCGKSSLLNLLAGLLTAQKGQLSVPQPVSYVFQEPRLLPWLSMLENAIYAMSPQLSKSEKMEQGRQLLQTLEMGDALALRPSQVSGGMAQRCALARALLAPHQILLLDEPLSSLHPELRERVAQFLRQHLEGQTVVLVSHDYATVRALGHQVFRLTAPPVRLSSVPFDKLELDIQQIEEDGSRSTPRSPRGDRNSSL